MAPPLTQRGTCTEGIARSESVPTLQLHKRAYGPVLPRLPQGRRLASTALFFLRQRRCLPSALRDLNDLKGFKVLSGLRGPSWPSRQHTPPPLRGTPSNLEGDVHTISTTPPDLPYRRGGVLWVVLPNACGYPFLLLGIFFNTRAEGTPKFSIFNFQFSISSLLFLPFHKPLRLTAPPLTLGSSGRRHNKIIPPLRHKAPQGWDSTLKVFRAPFYKKGQRTLATPTQRGQTN